MQPIHLLRMRANQPVNLPPTQPLYHKNGDEAEEGEEDDALDALAFEDLEFYDFLGAAVILIQFLFISLAQRIRKGLRIRLLRRHLLLLGEPRVAAHFTALRSQHVYAAVADKRTARHRLNVR